MKIFEIIGRAYMYWKLGWTNYYALLFGLMAYFTIIYNFVLYRYLPANPLTYAGIGIAVVVISIATGLIVKRSGFWGREHQISMEANPALNFPIGEKEILGFDASILGYETTIISLKNQIEVDKKLGVDTTKLLELLDRQEKMLERYREMRAKAKAGNNNQETDEK